MNKSVIIDCFFNDKKKYSADYTIVAIDVIRATTTAITAVALGRKCYPVSTLEMAISVSHNFDNPLLGGELSGCMPYGFEIQNSPSQLERRTDIQRAFILLSTSGTKLIKHYGGSNLVYLGCLRNYEALINHLSARHTKIALIGSGTREEFREEDQLCSAWIADGLFKRGFIPENNETEELIMRWRNSPIDIIAKGKSAAYLRDSGQEEDLNFILNHINDINKIYKLTKDEIIELTTYN